MSSKWTVIGLGSVATVALLAALTLWQVAQTRPPPTSDADALAILRSETQALRAELSAILARLDGLDARTSIGLTAPQPHRGENTARLPRPAVAPAEALTQNFAQVVRIADRSTANTGLTVASPVFLRETFGLPRAELDDTCRELTNPRLRGLIATEDVGPIRARLAAPALASLRRVFAEVAAFEPALYDRIASSGSLCVRLIRGATQAASAHAYGLAVDLNIDGQLDSFADGRTQLGLILLADYFHREGWIWGAGFSREDSMHFEVSREKIEEWRALGLL
ncbi:M15 family metallopeptidase [uncultured Roseobacter sp.]|uniref:M15 family metallopeptidase n=1 Tax=uncultured Roseobacter sp. TaxID=114847 RepID=UPI0026366723|nr:M15 family metallopeptidase [uncultured Roseobacter sp.]